MVKEETKQNVKNVFDWLTNCFPSHKKVKDGYMVWLNDDCILLYVTYEKQKYKLKHFWIKKVIYNTSTNKEEEIFNVGIISAERTMLFIKGLTGVTVDTKYF